MSATLSRARASLICRRPHGRHTTAPPLLLVQAQASMLFQTSRTSLFPNATSNLHVACGMLTAHQHTPSWCTRVCLQVEAEKVPEVSGHLNVTAVPTFIFLRRGDVADRLEGFDPGALYAKVDAFAEGGAANSAANGQNAAANGQQEDATAQLTGLVSQQPVMLFMKGSPDAPRCGFSRKVVDALRQENIPFGSFDILQNEAVCFVNWTVRFIKRAHHCELECCGRRNNVVPGAPKLVSCLHTRFVSSRNFANKSYRWADRRGCRSGRRSRSFQTGPHIHSCTLAVSCLAAATSSSS